MSDRRLLLVAASGLAREVLALERAAGRVTHVTVVDDDPSLWGTTLDGAPVVGGLDVVGEYDDHDVLVCVGHGRGRRAVVDRLHERGVGPDRFHTSIHPRVEVPDGCAVGRGSVLLEGVVLTTGVEVGRHAVLMPHVTLTHDDRICDYVTLCAGVSLGGAVQVAEEAYIGMNASVREGVTVGRGATLGMGAALVRDLPPGETWVGLPAGPSRERVR